MRTIPLNGKQILVVEVPEDASDIKALPSGLHLYYIPKGEKYHQSIELPEGQYKLLGRKEDVSEEVAKGLVEKSVHGISLFINYERQHYPYSTALESFHSWCRVNNITNEVMLEKL